MEQDLKKLAELAYEQTSTYSEYLKVYERLVLEDKARIA